MYSGLGLWSLTAPFDLGQELKKKKKSHKPCGMAKGKKVNNKCWHADGEIGSLYTAGANR